MNDNARSRKIRFFLLLAMFAGLSLPGQSFSVQGTFTYALTIYGQQQQPEPSARDFDVMYDDGAWRISVTIAEDKDFAEYVYSCDGTNIFYTAVPRRVRNTNVRTGALLEPCAVPQNLYYALGEYVWLAYSSGAYFSTLSKPIALSFEALRSKTGHRARVGVPCEFQLSSSAPHLPTHVRYMPEALARLSDTGELVSHPLPPPFENGYLRTEFRATGHTNIQGLEFPTSFECRNFILVQKPNAPAESYCTVRIQGQATNFSVREVTIPNELSGREYVVQDLRVPEPGTLYFITNGSIPAIDHTNVLAARALAARRFSAWQAEKARLEHNSARWVVVAALSLISGLPFAFFALRSARMKRGK